jgi:hypothetical protein
MCRICPKTSRKKKLGKVDVAELFKINYEDNSVYVCGLD